MIDFPQKHLEDIVRVLDGMIHGYKYKQFRFEDRQVFLTHLKALKDLQEELG